MTATTWNFVSIPLDYFVANHSITACLDEVFNTTHFSSNYNDFDVFATLTEDDANWKYFIWCLHNSSIFKDNDITSFPYEYGSTFNIVADKKSCDAFVLAFDNLAGIEEETINYWFPSGDFSKDYFTMQDFVDLL